MISFEEPLRWDPYFIRCGKEFETFWNSYLLKKNTNILYILGGGFDPRMCIGIYSIFQIKGSGIRDCMLICYDEGSSSPSKEHFMSLDINKAKLKLLIEREPIIRKIQMWSSESDANRRRVGSQKAADIFKQISELEKYDDIIIDISSMPKGVYFPLIIKVLSILDRSHKEQNKTPNLHVIVSEDAELDSRIREIGLDENVNYIPGFSEELNSEATSEVPKVWFPILGEGKLGQLKRIYDHILPDEICPILPSPSSNPRIGDKLLIDYRRLIFDEWRVDTKNIIYSNEKNPFETYRQLIQAIYHYRNALSPLSGCKPVISAVSSKLISLGALLAAYDLKLNKGINVDLVNIEAQGYEIIKPEEDIPDNSQLFTLLLKGEDDDS